MTTDHFVSFDAARILVADDDPILREFAAVHLATSSVEVETVEDGVCALDRLKQGGIDLLLVDLSMPRMDGFELIARLRSDPTFKFLPIVVVTGREDMAAVDRAYAAGATSFVVKPLNWRVLSHQLSYVLRNSRSEQVLRDAYQAALAAERVKTGMLQSVCREMTQPLQSIMNVARILSARAGSQFRDNESLNLISAAMSVQLTVSSLLESLDFVSTTPPIAKANVSIKACLADAARKALMAGVGKAELRLVDLTRGANAVLDRELTSSALEKLILLAHRGRAFQITARATFDANGALIFHVFDAQSGADAGSHSLATHQSDAPETFKPAQIADTIAAKGAEKSFTIQGGTLNLHCPTSGGFFARAILQGAQHALSDRVGSGIALSSAA